MSPDPKLDPAAVAEPADEARLYRALRLIRRSEEVIADIYPSDKIKSPVHLSIGQEAISMAVCDGLCPNDVVAGSCGAGRRAPHRCLRPSTRRLHSW